MMPVKSLVARVVVPSIFLLQGCGTDAESVTMIDQGWLQASAAASDEACLAPAWEALATYRRGDFVSHAGDGWRAKKNHGGIEPGSHPAYWSDLGACDSGPGDPPTPPPSEVRTPMQIFGVWHAGDHYADWSQAQDLVDFDQANHWLVDRGDGSGLPSVNLVVLSFLHPLKVLDTVTDAVTLDGVPIGMTQEIGDYFKAAGIRVMMSIGGVTYTDFWNEALGADPTQLGLNAAEIASRFGVGIEIDYEENQNPDLAGLQAFIVAYRSVHAYDPSGSNPAARLTIDLAAGGRYLQALNRYATVHWLDNANPVLDYANAMVHRASGSPDNWQEHVDGMLQYDPPIPPKAPNRFTGGLYLKGNTANCLDFGSSEQNQHEEYVHTVLPNGAGSTPGMLGFMFWAAGRPSARKNYVPTAPPNSCEGGMGVAAQTFDIPIPMETLRDK